MNPVSPEQLWIALAGAGVLILALSVAVSVLVFRHLMARRERSGGDEIAALRNDIHGLCAGARGIGNHLLRLEQRMRRIAERQGQLELREPASESYHHANRMMREGAGVEELVSSCGLSEGEASLLTHLYTLRQAGARTAPPR